MIRAIDIAKESLNWVYGGNLPGMTHAKTICVECDTLLIDRSVWYTENYLTESGTCPNCGFEVYGIFD